MEVIYDKLKYEERVNEMFTDLLGSDLLNVNIFELDYSALKRLIGNSRAYADERYYKSFGSFFTIKDVMETEYRGYRYKILRFCDEFDGIQGINLNRFIYPMSPIVSVKNHRMEYELANIPVRCTIDGVRCILDPILESMTGEKLFHLYSFSCVDDFGKRQRCTRFIYKDGDLTEDELRKYFIIIRIFILKYFIVNHSEFTLGVRHNGIGIYGIMHDNFLHFKSLFVSKYKKDFLKKLGEAERIAKEHNIQPYMETWLEKLEV